MSEVSSSILIQMNTLGNLGRKTISYEVVQVSTAAAKDGRFYINTRSEKPEQREVNETGRFGCTVEQLKTMAQNHGFNTSAALIAALNKGENTIHIPCEFHKVGEEYVDSNGNKRKYGFEADNTTRKLNSKGMPVIDNWQSDMISAHIEFSPEANKFINDLQMNILVTRESSAIDTNDEIAAARQKERTRKRLLLLGGGKLPSGFEETEDAEAEVIGSKKTEPKAGNK